MSLISHRVHTSEVVTANTNLVKVKLFGADIHEVRKVMALKSEDKVEWGGITLSLQEG
jgi:hypothetical protein